MAGCAASTAHRRADLCVTCRTRWKASELAWDDFLARPGGGRSRGDRPCRVTGCPRPGESDERLCATHTAQRRRHPGPAGRVVAGPAGGRAAALVRGLHRGVVRGRGGEPLGNVQRSQHRVVPPSPRSRRRGPGGVGAACCPGGRGRAQVVLRGLPDRVIAELLAGLQRRTDAGLRTLPTSTRCLVKLLHARQAAQRAGPGPGPRRGNPP